MARAKVNRGLDSETAGQVMSMAVGAAEALVMGVGHVAERAIAETARAAEDVGPDQWGSLLRWRLFVYGQDATVGEWYRARSN
jgi:hypothetical protein